MKNVSMRIERYEKEIAFSQESIDQEIQLNNQFILITKICLDDLREIVRTSGFRCREEEIKFFKCQKPYVLSRLKYYVFKQEYLVETEYLDVKEKELYINEKIKKLRRRKNRYNEFYTYYKLNESNFDQFYFTRGNSNSTFLTSPGIIEADPQFSTIYDFKIAEIKAVDMIKEYFRNELFCFERSKNHNVEVSMLKKFENLSWTGSKINLVELIYALTHSNQINNGQTTIKELSEVFGTLFNIDLSNVYKCYSKIKVRKKDPAKFLTNLATELSLNLENLSELK